MVPLVLTAFGAFADYAIPFSVFSLWSLLQFSLLLSEYLELYS